MNAPTPPMLPGSEPEDDNDAIDLASYLDFLLEHKWLIAAVALTATLLGGAYAFLTSPVYRANILLHVEDSSASSANMLGDLAAAFGGKTASTAEMEIVRSRHVVSRAVDNTRYYIEVAPKRFPLIGNAIARRSKELSSPGLFGMGGYTWGTEHLDVSQFNVPAALEGQSFTLTALDNGQYRVSHEALDQDLAGQVGQPLKAATALGDIELQVAALHGQSGAQFTLVRKPYWPTVETLQSALSVSEKGKQSGIIQVSLEGMHPARTATLLNEIGAEYVNQHVERKSEEAEKSLAFLNRQLPDLKAELERSETRYNDLRNKRGTIDLGGEAKAMLEQSVLAQTKMIELKQKREELQVRFQNDHPAVRAIDQQMQQLNRELDAMGARIKQLPQIEQDVLRLTRDVKVNTELYMALLNTAQQLRLMKASKIGNVRLLDPAVVPYQPVKPKKALTVLLAALVGIFLGVALAFIKKLLHGGVEDPQVIEQRLGVPVSATVPFSAEQEKLYAQIENKVKQVAVLATLHPSDYAVESLRSFRTSFQFSMLRAKSRIILFTGPTPGIGKSFVSVNFAAILGANGKRVLIIDADMRKGYLNRYFALERENGLSDVIAGQKTMDEAIHRNVLDNVDFLASGNLPPNPAELLGHAHFSELMEQVAQRYDYVLIDTAPVLAVSDALVVAPHAGAIFAVARAETSTLGEIEETVRRIHQTGSSVTGVVFNGLKPRAGKYGYKYGSKYRYTQYAY